MIAATSGEVKVRLEVVKYEKTFQYEHGMASSADYLEVDG